MATHTLQTSEKSTWYVDSGCTSHMARDEGLFVSLDKSAKSKVKMGNGEVVQAQGRGSVKIHTNKGTELVSDVLYVPSLAQNLLSVAQMLHKNYSLTFRNKMCIIYDPMGAEIARVSMVDNCFPVHWNSINQYALSAMDNETWLWHKRFGHYNLNSLKFMQSKGMILDLPKIKVEKDVCELYQLRKLHRQPFPNVKSWRVKEKLELVHTDVCGPMRTTSLNDSKYFLLFVDDFTRMS